MTRPHVYAAISAVTGALSTSGIEKSRMNTQEGYRFRGIDDIFDRLSPLLAEHKLCVLPRMLERERRKQRGLNGAGLISVCVKVAYDLISAEDGSIHTIEAYGEALDVGDKATSKAVSAAFKSAILQAFCIPISGRDDADAQTHRLARDGELAEPAEGWEQWATNIADLVCSCESKEAVDRVQTMYRSMLKQISVERRELYDMIGKAVRTQRAKLKAPVAKPTTRSRGARRAPAKSNGSSPQVAHG